MMIDTFFSVLGILLIVLILREVGISLLTESPVVTSVTSVTSKKKEQSHAGRALHPNRDWVLHLSRRVHTRLR